jgi:hypothetical protein
MRASAEVSSRETGQQYGRKLQLQLYVPPLSVVAASVVDPLLLLQCACALTAGCAARRSQQGPVHQHQP